MFWPDEIRSTGALDLPEGNEATRAGQGAPDGPQPRGEPCGPVPPGVLHRCVPAALEDLIEQKMRGETRKAKRRKPEPKVIDLMEALRASVDEAEDQGRRRRRSDRQARARGTARGRDGASRLRPDGRGQRRSSASLRSSPRHRPRPARSRRLPLPVAARARASGSSISRRSPGTNASSLSSGVRSPVAPVNPPPPGSLRSVTAGPAPRPRRAMRPSRRRDSR